MHDDDQPESTHACFPLWSKSTFVYNGTTTYEDQRLSQTGGDWSPDFAKIQCPDNYYVKGFARPGEWYPPPVILCCSANLK